MSSAHVWGTAKALPARPTPFGPWVARAKGHYLRFNLAGNLYYFVSLKDATDFSKSDEAMALATQFPELGHVTVVRRALCA